MQAKLQTRGVYTNKAKIARIRRLPHAVNLGRTECRVQCEAASVAWCAGEKSTYGGWCRPLPFSTRGMSVLADNNDEYDREMLTLKVIIVVAFALMLGLKLRELVQNKTY